jgi:hypothetical protein
MYNRRNFLKGCAASIPAILSFPSLVWGSITNEEPVVVKKATHPFLEYCKGVTYYDYGDGARKPFELQPDHYKILDAYEENQYVIYKKYRQGAFSTFNVTYAGWLMTHKPGTRVLFIARTDRECLSNSDCFQRGLPEEARRLVVKSNHHMVEMENGSFIGFFTPEACRGKSCNLVIFDEAAFIEGLDRWYEALYPVIATGGKLFAYSTPNGRRGWFFDTYMHAIEKKNNFKVVYTDYRTCPHEMYQSPVKIEVLKANLGMRGFRQEVLAEFI